MGLKIEKKQPVALTVVETKGMPAVETEEKVGDPVVMDKPMANVGMKVGMTKNLGNYESVRVDVSLYLPCEADDEAVNNTFDLVNTWVDMKMAEIMDEYEEGAS
jgi:hypothetical protein